jgi:ferric iron reductase protein FhuF
VIKKEIRKAEESRGNMTMCQLEEERLLLENKFRLYFSQNVQMKYRFEGVDLLQPEILDQLITVLGKETQSSFSIAHASLFSKYFVSLVASGALFAMSCLNRALDVSLDNISVELNDDWNALILLKRCDSLRDLNSIPFSRSENREEWREKIIQSIFAKNIQPVFQSLVHHTGIKSELLWANTAFSIYYHFEKWMEEAKTDELKNQINHDFIFLTKEAKADLFGLSDKNPLNIDFDLIDHPLLSGEKFRLRKVCCLRYQLANGSCCTTCPRLDSDARKEALVEYQKR